MATFMRTTAQTYPENRSAGPKHNTRLVTLITRLICVIAPLSLVACAEQPEPPLLPSNVTWSADPRTVRAVQATLQNRHYYAGLIDGYFGQATGDAIERFRIDHGLRVKPVIDRSLLNALETAASPHSRRLLSD
jgi:peptidoglycan hydrolase-like protein with peptidoglycan-binding domain